MDICQRKAYAKINLGLDVIGRRPDGYHEVRMIMQTVDLYDELTLQKTDAGIVMTTDSGELPTDGENLVCKAAKLMMDEFSVGGGVKIHLRKRIPIAAGMAGGSTDAAATMKGIRELFALDVPESKLMELGVRIGADVPYCIMGGTALAEGIGEKLSALPAPPECVLVVAKPNINVSTKYVYEHLDAAADYPHPDIDGMVQALRDGSLKGIAQRLGNVLESVTVEQYPIVGRIREIMKAGGAQGALMSGSGPTVFGLFESLPQAQAAADRIRGSERLEQVYVTGFTDGR